MKSYTNHPNHSPYPTLSRGLHSSPRTRSFHSGSFIGGSKFCFLSGQNSGSQRLLRLQYLRSIQTFLEWKSHRQSGRTLRHPVGCYILSLSPATSPYPVLLAKAIQYNRLRLCLPRCTCAGDPGITLQLGSPQMAD